MKVPQSPPPFNFGALKDQNKFKSFLSWLKTVGVSALSPLDKLRHHKIEGYTSEELWMAAKFQRIGTLKAVPLLDKAGRPFQFCVPELVQENLHRIDVGGAQRLALLSRLQIHK